MDSKFDLATRIVRCVLYVHGEGHLIRQFDKWIANYEDDLITKREFCSGAMVEISQAAYLLALDYADSVLRGKPNKHYARHLKRISVLL